ncbi:type III secretion system stator protein SctL [Roseiconus lacunae]|uniref:type III secretion system stator protein SctL n=1 Tax=Roseiconus lacunae TaxID=2605694 RepID=UPI001E51CA01|nr:type III secretion system stator protein SctL [Roseiconus lacunae]MCD0457874.1 type III secretion system stator protein SctL [Roseiconus lacunae]
MFSILEQCERAPQSARILSGKQYAASMDADAIYQHALDDASRIIQRAEDEYVRQKALGYHEGLRLAELEKSQKAIEIAAAVDNYFQSIEAKVRRLVVQGIEGILGEWSDDEIVARVVSQTLAWARNESRVTLRVCANRVESVRNRLAELQTRYPAIDLIDIVADGTLGERACLLDTPIGSIHSDVEEQLKQIESSFAEMFSVASAGPRNAAVECFVNDESLELTEEYEGAS